LLPTITKESTRIRTGRTVSWAFREWLYKLKKGERLPRGKYFRGRKSGRPIFFIDEMNILTNSYTAELIEWQSGLYK